MSQYLQCRSVSGGHRNSAVGTASSGSKQTSTSHTGQAVAGEKNKTASKKHTIRTLNRTDRGTKSAGKTNGIAQLDVRFWTAWGPAIEGLTTISAMFPRLEFSISYEDEGGGFYGCAEFRSGKFGDCSVDPDSPHYPQFTGDDDENSAQLVGDCFYHCEAEAFRLLTESQLETVSA